MYLPDPEDLSCSSIVETSDKNVVGDPHADTKSAQLPRKIFEMRFSRLAVILAELLCSFYKAIWP
jgi:hypothetical protein